MKVLIAGAGLSGMYAAWQLERAGHDVQIIEAKDRVGGRTWSHLMSNGDIAERGGEFIFPTDHLMRQVAAELKLPVITHGIIFNRRWSEQGTRLSVAELRSASAAFLETVNQLSAAGDFKSSIDDAAERTWGFDFRLHPAYIRFVTSLANDPSKVSAASLLAKADIETAPYFEHGGRVYGGNQGVCNGIAKLLNRPVRLNSELTGFSQNGSGVTFSLSCGEELAADAAVLSVPLPVLRKLDGYKALDALKRQALDCRVMGTAAKLSALTVGKSTSRGVQYPGTTWWCWNSLSHDDDAGGSVVTGFAGGHETVSGLNTSDGGATWAGQIAEIRPDLELADEFLVTDWTHDPYTGGAYSAAGLEWNPEYARVFDTPDQRVAIAGEHTWESTMNGALLSGYRAAKLICELTA